MPFAKKDIKEFDKSSKLYGYIIRKARVNEEASINSIAEATFINPSHLSKVEHGVCAASDDYKKILEASLFINVDDRLETVVELKELLNKCLEYWAICNLEELKNIYSNLRNNENKYINSFAVPYYYVIIIFLQQNLEINTNETKYYLEELNSIKELIEPIYQFFAMDLNAKALLNEGENEEAKKNYKNMKQFGFDVEENGLILANVYVHMMTAFYCFKEFEVMMQYYEKALVILCKALMFERIVYITVTMTLYYSSNKKYQEAIKLTNNILKYNNRTNNNELNDVLYSNLCEIYVKNNQYNEAIGAIKQITSVDEYDSYMLFIEPFIYYCLEENSKMESTIKRNLKHKNNDELSSMIMKFLEAANNIDENQCIKICDELDKLIMKIPNKNDVKFIFDIVICIAEKINSQKIKVRYLENIRDL
ncbi:MAG: hypothetical protein RR557_07485 [Bacilli bacterium]